MFRKSSVVTIVLLFVMLVASSVVARSIPGVSRIARVVADFEYISSALVEFKNKTGAYPSTEQGLSLLVPGVLKKPLKDPWGRLYNYEVGLNSFRVWSFGRDGIVGGNGEDYDFSSDTPIENEKNKKQVASENSPLLDWYVLIPILILLILFVLIYYMIKKIVKTLRSRRAN